MDIRIDNLHFTYPSGVEALRGVSLAIEAGELVAIVGQNGSGKTTLVKHLNGLLEPTSGTVQIGDWDTADHSVAQMAARVGYVFQNPDDQLFKSTVQGELAFGPTNLKHAPEKVARMVEEAMTMLDVHPYADENPYDLTPTLRKRVTIASIVAMQTPIIVLDEPTTGQDFQFVSLLSDVIRSLHEAGRTVIAISHDIDFVAENFKRIIVMGQGEILLDGPGEAVFAETETLNSTFVEPPQVTRLGQRLGFEAVASTPAQFLEQLRTYARPD